MRSRPEMVLVIAFQLIMIVLVKLQGRGEFQGRPWTDVQ